MESDSSTGRIPHENYHGAGNAKARGNPIARITASFANQQSCSGAGVLRPASRLLEPDDPGDAFLVVRRVAEQRLE